MTDTRMTPDEFAKAVSDLGAEHGVAITYLEFNSQRKAASGTHSYRGVSTGGFGKIQMTMLPARPHT